MTVQLQGCVECVNHVCSRNMAHCTKVRNHTKAVRMSWLVGCTIVNPALYNKVSLKNLKMIFQSFLYLFLGVVDMNPVHCLEK